MTGYQPINSLLYDVEAAFPREEEAASFQRQRVLDREALVRFLGGKLTQLCSHGDADSERIGFIESLLERARVLLANFDITSAR